MDDFHKPNLIVPLVPAYDTRRQSGVPALAAGLDQRKINCYYDLVPNHISQQTTAILAKRPGVELVSTPDYGSASQKTYFVARKPTPLVYSDVWFISLSGNDVRASDGSTTTVISSAASTEPSYWDTTSISDVETFVLQTRNTTTYAQKAWYASVIGSWTEITDAVFAALTVRGKIEHIDGWALALDSRNRIYNSNLNTLAVWPGAYITKQIQQDVPAGLAKLGQRIVAFGDETAEVLVNAGNPSGSPLITIKDMAARTGLGTLSGSNGSVLSKTHYYAELGGKIYFVGRQAGGTFSQSLMVFDGERFERVSNNAFDKVLASNAFYSVDRVGFMGQQAIAIDLTLKSATSGAKWLMFFPQTKEWFEWHSDDFRPSNYGDYFAGVSSPHRRAFINPAAENWNDPSNHTMTIQFVLPKQGAANQSMLWCGVDGDTARSASTLSITFSDDDYQNFPLTKTIDMTSKRKRANRCGLYQGRNVKIAHTGNVEVRLKNFNARVM